ncbi:MAG: 50S ribosomal protein L24 [Candidatus Tagabacteria bacterium RIFCSPLOWO2_01_FULL_42_9]|uniref:Large ribosomal subunit protein uL24 n=1 Tax=Candidatus Tagabacteria bacterium RIFCSPLOWO2_01_FULL_42_9 TaxID=1802296 RepID=A0A1G2LWY0_9BACT|nr:MAG: 50S ribosomal protein L24 [Candidatus Tagabacteria bacterium RIFCSPLOWO2_01_FULL_42_9]
MKIKKNDNVMVISGKDRGKSGKVIRIFPKSNSLVVEGINIRKKHSRSKKQGQKGQIIQKPMPLNASNVMLICPACNKPRRAGYKIFSAEGGSASGGENKKIRVCKKCGSGL